MPIFVFTKRSLTSQCIFFSPQKPMIPGIYVIETLKALQKQICFLYAMLGIDLANLPTSFPYFVWVPQVLLMFFNPLDRHQRLHIFCENNAIFVAWQCVILDTDPSNIWWPFLWGWSMSIISHVDNLHLQGVRDLDLRMTQSEESESYGLILCNKSVQLRRRIGGWMTITIFFSAFDAWIK